MNFNQYLLFDGEHAVAREAREMEERSGRPFSLGSTGVHKIYRFPNGYGASVVKGWFSRDMWEIFACEFDDDVHMIVGDMLRFDTFTEIEEALMMIFKYGVQTIEGGN